MGVGARGWDNRRGPGPWLFSLPRLDMDATMSEESITFARERLKYWQTVLAHAEHNGMSDKVQEAALYVAECQKQITELQTHRSGEQ